MLIGFFDVGVNSQLQLGNIGKSTSPDTLLRKFAKPALDQIQPGTAGRREMNMKARVATQPTLDLGVLMGCVVVNNQMEIELFGRRPVNCPQESKPFIVTVPWHHLGDDMPLRDIQSSK